MRGSSTNAGSPIGTWRDSMANNKREPRNGRNPDEDYAHRFGLTNADCLKDPRIGRLVHFKQSLDEQVRAAIAVNIKSLLRAVGYSPEESDHLDPRVVSVCEGIRDAQRFLAILTPKKKLNTKEPK